MQHKKLRRFGILSGLLVASSLGSGAELEVAGNCERTLCSKVAGSGVWVYHVFTQDRRLVSARGNLYGNGTSSPRGR